jgi:FkbM family methyltransferase
MPAANVPKLSDRLLTFYARHRWRGFLTLQKMLGKHTINLRTRYGATFTLHPADYIDRVVLEEGFYESEVFEALRPYFAPDAILWDIGANFGLHSVSAAVSEPAMQVHSFEPSLSMRSRLQAQAALNHVIVNCWPLALGDHDGSATLHINASGNPGMTTMTPWQGGRYDSRETVRVARADTLINSGQIPAPTIIKIDVEGGEAAVLAGFGTRLRHPALRAVVFEAHADMLSVSMPCPAADLLRAAGFSFTALARRENSAHALSNFLANRRIA